MFTIASKIQKNDVLCFYALNKLIHYPLLNYFMNIITQLGSTTFAVAFSLTFILISKSIGIVLVVNLICSQMIIHILKRLVDRPRPYKTLEWAIAINPPKCKYSLPSGHSGSALTIALVLASFFPILKIFLIAIAVLVGISRVYLGCHYPTDVTLGFIISYSTFTALEILVFI